MKRLTSEEQEHVRVALRFLRIRTGGWKVLSKVLGFAMGSMINVKKKRVPVSVNLAFQVSRLTMVPFDDLIAGKYPPPGACPHCGHGAEFPVAAR